MREQESTTSIVAEIADGGPRRAVPRPDVDAVLGALDHAIAVVDADWRIVAVNSAWERVLGRPSVECLRRDIFACFPMFSGPAASEMLHATRADGTTRRFDVAPGLASEENTETFGVRVAVGAGDLLVLEIARPFEDAVLDATSSERFEENASLRALAHQMAEVADSRQLLQLLCAAASSQCRGSGAAVIKTSADEGEVVAAVGEMAVAIEHHFPLAGSVVAEALQNKGAIAIEQYGSSPRPLARVVSEMRVGPMLAAPLVAHDMVLGVLTVVREERGVSFSAEETQRLGVIADHAALAMWKAELLEQARAADRAKGRFLATVSHELRTPLTALTGYEELLADEVLGPLSEPQTDVLERMRSVTHHLTVMIEEVLAFSSIEAGREVVRPSDFLADDLLRAACVVVEPLARQKKLRVVCDLPAEPIRMTSDIDKVRQVLVNLAGNAVKFTDRGEVRLTLQHVCSAEGVNEVHFMVHDTGSGIAPDEQRLLFRPFSQLDTGLTRRHGGTGLGLYIAHRLAQLLGGRVEVASVPGAGSTFTLALPQDASRGGT